MIPTNLKNISKIGSVPQIGVTIVKNIENHQPVNIGFGYVEDQYNPTMQVQTLPGQMILRETSRNNFGRHLSQPFVEPSQDRARSGPLGTVKPDGAEVGSIHSPFMTHTFPCMVYIYLDLVDLYGKCAQVGIPVPWML